jgi:hypothetical protein
MAMYSKAYLTSTQLETLKEKETLASFPANIQMKYLFKQDVLPQD